MATRDYPKPEAEPNPQSQQSPVAQSGAGTSQVLDTLTQVFSTFQKHLQNQPPREFDANTLAAASVFNDIIAGLELRPLSNVPALKINPEPQNKIKLEWDWIDNDEYTAKSFKIWRCEGQDCQNFSPIAEINSEAGRQSYSYIDDKEISTGNTYRYLVSAITSRGERFSQSEFAVAKA
jgi:hypothetical protein